MDPAVTVQLAVPEDRAIVLLPSAQLSGTPVADLITNVTLPLGVPWPGRTVVTVAVKVTAWPDAAGLAEDVIAVVVVALVTFWVSGAAEDGTKFPAGSV